MQDKNENNTVEIRTVDFNELTAEDIKNLSLGTVVTNIPVLSPFTPYQLGPIKISCGILFGRNEPFISFHRGEKELIIQWKGRSPKNRYPGGQISEGDRQKLINF